MRIRVVFFPGLVLGDKVLDSGKTFRAHSVFHAAGIFHGDFFIYAQADEPLGKDGMTFIHGLSDLHSLFCQGDITVIHMNVTIFPEDFS